MDEAVLDLTTQVLTGYLSNNVAAGDRLPDLIRSVYQSLSTARAKASAPVPAEPAVDVRKSVTSDHLVCLACGRHFSMLKRHLKNEHQLTPTAYLERYGLKSSYPLVAPSYARFRSALAKKIGLGRKAGGKHRA